MGKKLIGEITAVRGGPNPHHIIISVDENGDRKTYHAHIGDIAEVEEDIYHTIYNPKGYDVNLSEVSQSGVNKIHIQGKVLDIKKGDTVEFETFTELIAIKLHKIKHKSFVEV